MKIISLFNGIYFSRMNKIFMCLIIFQLATQIYYYNQTIEKIGVNEHGLLGYTTEAYYHNCAKNMALYGIHSDGEYPEIKPTNYRPPLFSFLISIIYKIFSVNEVHGLIFNNILLLLTTIIIFKIGNLFNPQIGLLSAILFVAEPYLLERANSIQSEIPHIFFFSFALYFSIKIFYLNKDSNKNIILFSLLFFLSTFVRTVTLYYPIIFLMFLIMIYRMQTYFIKDHQLNFKKIGLIFILINLFGTMAWSTRNYIHTDNFDYTGMKGIHLGLFVAPGVYAAENNIDYAAARKIIRNKYFNDEKFYSLDIGDQQKYLASVGKKIIIENPIGFLKHYFGRSFRLLFFGYPTSAMLPFYSKEKMIYAENIMKKLSSSFSAKLSILGDLFSNGFKFYTLHIVFFKIFYVLFLLSSLAGSLLMVFQKTSTNDRLIGLFIGSIFYYLIAIYLFNAGPRLRIGLLPIMVIFSSQYLIYLKSYFIQKTIRVD